MDVLLEILKIAIPAASAICVAVITGKFAKQAKKSDARADQRRRESLLALELMNANTSLTIGVAMALKHGHANGEIEQGLADVEDARKKYDKFHNEIVAGHLN